ncbi:c-type cytochrome [Alteromonadaceae bacterium M269]|nr:c-type cytochrome [Alteromonadaceae bacterium M269]
MKRPVTTRKVRYLASLSIYLLASTISNAQAADKEAGKALYKETCARCHSKLIGRKITGSPKLTNTDEAYITARLKGYAQDEHDYTDEKKYKQRMIDTAKSLSDEDIKNIAAYLSSK